MFPKNKSLSCSLGQLKLLLPWDMILTWGKTNFLKEQWISPREGPSSLGKHMFQFFVQSQSSHISFYISLQPIVRKVLRKTTTLYLKALQFDLQCKNYDHTNFQTHFSSKEHNLNCSSEHMVVPKRAIPLRNNHVPLGSNLNHVPWGATIFP